MASAPKRTDNNTRIGLVILLVLGFVVALINATLPEPPAKPASAAPVTTAHHFYWLCRNGAGDYWTVPDDVPLSWGDDCRKMN